VFRRLSHPSTTVDFGTIVHYVWGSRGAVITSAPSGGRIYLPVRDPKQHRLSNPPAAGFTGAMS
jgi:hypothetical protein